MAESYNETTFKMFCGTWPTTSSLPQQFRLITATAFLSTLLSGSFLPNKHSPRSGLHTFMYTWHPYKKFSWLKEKLLFLIFNYKQSHDGLCLNFLLICEMFWEKPMHWTWQELLEFSIAKNNERLSGLLLEAIHAIENTKISSLRQSNTPRFFKKT